MGKFNFIKTPIKGLIIVEQAVFEDERGFFMESYNYRDFKQGGIDVNFVQEQHPQGKLIRVVKGKVFDVAVDVRKSLSTFGKWFGIELSEENKKQFYIPHGFAHGFLSLEDNTEFLYKCTEYYFPNDEGGIIWNDSTINIQWPLEKIEKLIISDKDKLLPTFEEVVKCL